MNIKRIKKFLKLYRLGATLQEIGEKENLTRERVRQILSLSPIYKELRKKRIESHYRVIKCFICSKLKTYRLSKLNRKLCSKKCLGKYLNKQARLRHSKSHKCPRCGEIKSPDEFYNKKVGLKYSHCKLCHDKTTNSWRKRNPERIRKINRRACKKYYSKLKEHKMK